MAACVVGIVAVTLAPRFSQITTREFNQYLSAADSSRQVPFLDLVADYHAHAHGWSGVDSVLNEIARVSGHAAVIRDENGAVHLPTIGPLADAQFARGTKIGSIAMRDYPDLVHPAGTHVEVTPEGMLRIRRDYKEGGTQRQSILLLNGSPVLSPDGRRIGTLYLAPGHLSPGMPQSRESTFIERVNRGIVMTVIVAVVFATFAGLLGLRRALKPIEALTAAARRMEGGDRDARVVVHTRDEIGELAHAFNAMADSVARTERLRRDLVSDVAHELRTPLTNLRCQIEALQDGLTTADPRALASLHEETLLLGRLIEDLQQLALAEAGQLRLVLSPLDVREAAQSTLEALAARAASDGVTLTNEVPNGLPPVQADPERVGQILRNLLDNALRHAPEGGHVSVGARQVEGAIELFVRDDGPGIAAEHLPNLFERFYRTDASRARATGGSGLGLAIVRQLVTAHGGRVRVESTPGQGATCFFTLPIVPPA
jgi:signal transduction histidine kinase